MTIEHFGELLKGNNGISVTDDLIIFNDFELYNFKTKESKKYDTLEALLEDNPDIKAIIEKADAFYANFD